MKKEELKNKKCLLQNDPYFKEDKEKTRQEIANCVDLFLKNGGKIEIAKQITKKESIEKTKQNIYRVTQKSKPHRNLKFDCPRCKSNNSRIISDYSFGITNKSSTKRKCRDCDCIFIIS